MLSPSSPRQSNVQNDQVDLADRQHPIQVTPTAGGGDDEAMLRHALHHRLADVGIVFDDRYVYGLIHGNLSARTLTLWHRL